MGNVLLSRVKPPVLSGNAFSYIRIRVQVLCSRTFQKFFLRSFRLDVARYGCTDLTSCNKMISNKEYFQKCLCVVSSTCILASRNQTSYPMCHAYSCIWLKSQHTKPIPVTGCTKKALLESTERRFNARK